MNTNLEDLFNSGSSPRAMPCEQKNKKLANHNQKALFWPGLLVEYILSGQGHTVTDGSNCRVCWMLAFLSMEGLAGCMSFRNSPA